MSSFDVAQDKSAPRNGQGGTTFSIYPQGTPNNPIVLIVIARSQQSLSLWEVNYLEIASSSRPSEMVGTPRNGRKEKSHCDPPGADHAVERSSVSDPSETRILVPNISERDNLEERSLNA
jgi:hypothetical protein